MTELARLLNTFLCVWLPRDRNASPQTIGSYTTSLNMLAVFAAERHGTRPCKLEVEQFDTETILAFLTSLEEEHGNSVATRNVRLAAVKSFFRFIEFRKPAYLSLAGQVRTIPVKKGERPLIGNLDRAEIRALLDAPDRKTRAGIRDHAMMILTYNAGLRVSELVSLTPDDLKAPRFDQVRVMGKGRRERVLPLWKKTTTATTAWLLIRPDVEDPHLFLNAMNKGVTRRGFAKRLALHGETAAWTVPSLAERTVNPPPPSPRLCDPYLGGYRGRQEGESVVGPFQHANYGDVSPCGAFREARNAQGVAPAGASQGNLPRGAGRAARDARSHQEGLKLTGI